jgi:hypothetical protein
MVKRVVVAAALVISIAACGGRGGSASTSGASATPTVASSVPTTTTSTTLHFTRFPDALTWFSADGSTWSRVSDLETQADGPLSQTMRAVVAGGPGLVAVGAAVWVSSDGEAWSLAPDSASSGWVGPTIGCGVAAGGPGLVAVGYDG